MNYSTFIAPVLALMSAIQPVGAVTQVPEGYGYITTANDQEMYFGKVVARSGDIAFMKVFRLEPSGEQGGWLGQYNCADNTWEDGEGNWQPVNPETVGAEIYKHACK